MYYGMSIPFSWHVKDDHDMLYGGKNRFTKQ